MIEQPTIDQIRARLTREDFTEATLGFCYTEDVGYLLACVTVLEARVKAAEALLKQFLERDGMDLTGDITTATREYFALKSK